MTADRGETGSAPAGGDAAAPTDDADAGAEGATDSDATDRDASEDEASDGDPTDRDAGEESAEVTRFERAFLDHPLARDLVLFGFLAGFYGGFMWLVLPLPVTWGVGMGVAFAVGWLALMELYCWRRDTSMLRSIGEDPYAPIREGD